MVAPSTTGLVSFCAESSALLRGIRKGARDFDIADSSGASEEQRRMFWNLLLNSEDEDSSGLHAVDEMEGTARIDLAERETLDCPRKAHVRVTLPNIVNNKMQITPSKQRDLFSPLLLVVE